MSVKLSINKNSLRELNKNLTKTKNLINRQVNHRFLELSLIWLKEKSIEHLVNNYPDRESQTNINEIANSFEFIITKQNARLVNNHNKAVYIEFGVGIVGQGTHPKSSVAKIGGGDYRYNLPSEAKTRASSYGYSDAWFYKGITKGNQAAMYMYNAFMDYYHGGKYREIYKQAFSEIMSKKQ